MCSNMNGGRVQITNYIHFVYIFILLIRFKINDINSMFKNCNANQLMLFVY